MNSRKGFTLIELVVVVMVIGIIAAIAVPKLVNITGAAADNAAAQSLGVLRNAVETYAAEHAGNLPTGDEAAVKTALLPYIRGQFPRCPVGPGTGDGISVVTAGTPLVGTGDATPTKAWKYDSTSGEIIINFTSTNKAGVRYDNL
jgi:general secretion pathway protein G